MKGPKNQNVFMDPPRESETKETEVAQAENAKLEIQEKIKLCLQQTYQQLTKPESMIRMEKKTANEVSKIMGNLMQKVSITYSIDHGRKSFEEKTRLSIISQAPGSNYSVEK